MCIEAILYGTHHQKCVNMDCVCVLSKHIRNKTKTAETIGLLNTLSYIYICLRILYILKLTNGEIVQIFSYGFDFWDIFFLGYIEFRTGFVGR